MGSSPSDQSRARPRLLVVVVLGAALWGVACKQAPAPDVSWFREHACTSCHVEGGDAPEPTCTGCHVRRGIQAMGEPEPRPAAPELYGTAPSLVMLAGLEPRKFTEPGLRRFLAAPEARMSQAVAMFPLHHDSMEAAVALLAIPKDGLSWRFASPSPDRSRQERGQALYESLGCRSCHEDARTGPRLRLGYPLLSAAFFAAKLREPRPARWPGAQTQPMPAFAWLSERDIDALYSYVSSTRDDAALRVSQPAAPQLSSLMSDRALYQLVAGALVEASCRHCHGTAPATRREIHEVFASTGLSAELAFGIERAGEALGFAAISTATLSPGAGCSESPLVRRLRARAQEWAGAPTDVRGMPLTLAPLHPDTIRIIDVWTKRGCPSPQGALCRKCER